MAPPRSAAAAAAAKAAARDERLLEQLLEPVYASLDRRDDRGAARLAAAALAKCEGDEATVPVATLQALRAVALVRAGIGAEATEAVDSVMRYAHCDERVLAPLAAALREGRIGGGRLARMYEAALSREPGNEGLLDITFDAHCRDFAFLKQQQMAMKLYRSDAEEPYLLWATVAMLLQARHGLRDEGAGGSTAGAVAPEKLLTLAEMMLRKRLADSGLETAEALLVFVEVLAEQGKHAEAADLLEGDAGKLITLEADRRRAIAELRAAKGDREAAARQHRALLDANPDDWLAIVGFMDATLALGAADLSTALESCEEMVEGLSVTAAAIPNGEKLRGPRLARCELALRRLRGGADPDAPAALVDTMVAFVEAHGHLASAAVDLCAYSRALREGGHAAATDELARRVLELAEKGGAEEGGGAEHKRQRKLCSAYAIALDCGAHRDLDASEAASVAARLCGEYAAAVVKEADVDAREHIPADGLLVSAANALFSAAGKMTSPAREGTVLLAIAVLERGCARSSHHADMRFALMSAYLALGCPTRAHAHAKPLDLKNIQMDTLSHHLLPALDTLGSRAVARSMRRAVEKLHDDHESGDAGDMYVLALRSKAFSKASEMVAFKQRLAASHQLADVRADKALEEALVACMTAGVEAAPAGAGVDGDATEQDIAVAASGLDTLRANEDMGLRPFWDPLPGACALCGADAVEGLGGRQNDLPAREEAAWRSRVEQKRLLVLVARAAAAAPASAPQALALAESHARAADIAAGGSGNQCTSLLLGAHDCDMRGTCDDCLIF